MEMQRGPRGLRDREYPDDVQGHVDAGSEPVEGGEQTENEPVDGEAPESNDEDEVQGHVAHQAFGDQIDGRER